MFNLRLLASLCNLNYLQISVTGKTCKFWSIYFEVLSVTWLNFTIVKYDSKTSIIYHQIKISKRYNKQVFNKTTVLKNFAIFTENHLRCSHLLNKNAGLQSWNFIKKRLDQYAFGLPRTPKSLIPFFTSKHTFFTSNNAIFNIITHTHFFYTF